MEMDSTSDQAQPYAPYGKACLNCQKSKTRCASSNVGGKCQRCHRLNKDCQPAPAVRQKRVSKRPASTLKTTALEEKLDGIVQMLQRSQESNPDTRQGRGQILNESIDPRASSGVQDANQISQREGSGGATVGYSCFPAANDRPLIGGNRLDEIAQPHEPTNRSKMGRDGFVLYPANGHPLTPATSIAGHSTMASGPEIPIDYPLESEAELEEYLATYRTKMVPYFPIVCINATTTVEELRNDRPFLFLVIRAICSKNLERQAALILLIKKVLGREMLLDGTKNLDLFLGVLMFVAWCHVYICIKPVNSTIVQLGISLAYELGLTRPPPGEPVRVLLNYTAQGCPKPTIGMNLERTMEERRAVVGLYLITSVFANYFQRIEFMRWTRYLDECLRHLEEKQEYPTDDLLVCLVRVQLICNKGSALTWNDVLGNTEMGVPTDLYVKTLKTQLDNLERSIPGELKSNVTLQLHFLNTTLTIHEHSLSATSEATSDDPAAQLQRIESLWICLTVVKSWFNIFFDPKLFPLSCYTHFSMAILTQMGHCLVALFRLSTFEATDISWDRQRVRREMDLGDTVKRIVDTWEQVPLATGMEMSPRLVAERDNGQLLEGSWLYGMRGLSVVRNYWEAKAAAMTAADAERKGGPELEVDGAMYYFGMPGSEQMDALEFGAMHMDILDDTWVRDILGGYDFNL